MRNVIIALFLIGTLAGCQKPGPIHAGGKSVSHWVQALRDPDPKVRKTAVTKLGNVGMADATALPAVVAALKDEDADVRCQAVVALVKFGPNAEPGVPELKRMTRDDPDPKVRDYAAKGLARIESQTSTKK